MQSNTQFFSVPEETDNKRYGMYKNFRIGIVKFYKKGENGSNDSALIESIESCYGTSGSYYASYNLYVDIDKKFSDKINMSSVGKWVLFGFYIQSFRGVSGFTTALKLRHYEELESLDSVRIELFDPRLQDVEKVRGLTVPSIALKLMHEISDKTKFNEYGKR